jgi:hypothetical protein
MCHHRITRFAAAALALAAFAAPAHASQDLRSPDTRDAALAPVRPQDLRSPDTRDAALVSVRSQDLRSPDTRDAAAGRGMRHAPEVTVVKLTAPAPAADRGIDWGDAGIGAATLLALMMLGGAVAFVVLHRRSETAATS